MKFFAIFSTILAVTCAVKREWTIHELTEAIQSPYTDPTMLPYLEEHLNELLSAMNEGDLESSYVPVEPAFEPIPWEFSTWTLDELSEALQNPNTDPALLPYLESALNALMAELISGQQQDSVVIATPVGLLPVEVAPVRPPPTPAVTPEVSAYSPLVQIIVNVKEQQAAPTPVPVAPVPVNPVVVMPPQPINPVDVVAIYPPESIINPIDVIAITPPESIINPIDVIAISPVVPSVVGPI